MCPLKEYNLKCCHFFYPQEPQTTNMQHEYPPRSRDKYFLGHFEHPYCNKIYKYDVTSNIFLHSCLSITYFLTNYPSLPFVENIIFKKQFFRIKAWVIPIIMQVFKL